MLFRSTGGTAPRPELFERAGIDVHRILADSGGAGVASAARQGSS